MSRVSLRILLPALSSRVLTVSVYIPSMLSFLFCLARLAPQCLKWHEEGLTYDWEDTNTRAYNLTIIPSEHVKHNGSLYAHMVLSKSRIQTGTLQARSMCGIGFNVCPTCLMFAIVCSPGDRYGEIFKTQQLNAYKPLPKLKQKKNLISGKLNDQYEQAVVQKVCAIVSLQL